MLHRLHPKTAIYYFALALVLAIGVYLRIHVAHVGREIIPGDETTYHYAALDIIKYHTLTREISGDMYGGRTPVVPTSWLSPGYPIFIAAVYLLSGVSTKAVLTAHVAMSVLWLFLILKLLDVVGVNRPGKLVSLSFVAVYPGFLYNTDRLLTEQLFVFLFTLYVYLFLKGWKQQRLALIVASGVVLACAGHVRAQAMPFLLLSMLWLAIYGQGTVRQKSRAVLGFTLPLLVLFLPWCIRNYLDFGHFILFTEAGDGAKIWGSVPYFIDMGSSNQFDLSAVIANNRTPNPAVYYRWRLFGFLQYMWGDVWDENLVHPHMYLRWMLAIQPLVVVPTLVATPLILLRKSPVVQFIAAIPLAFTVMNFPFHGLPRYVYPGVPFLFVLLGVAVSYLAPRVSCQGPEPIPSGTLDKMVRFGLFAASVPLSLLTLYSVYVFAGRENLEMSAYRLSRYMGVKIPELSQATLVEDRVIPGSSLIVDNAIRSASVYTNTPQAPVIINIDDAPTRIAGAKVVTEVSLRMQGGFLYDYSTVYWTGTRNRVINEDHVYRFPNNAFAKGRRVYIDDDVTHLMIVPYVFRGGSFEIRSVGIRKYLITDRK